MEQYEIVRREESWGGQDGAYYRMLPEVPTNDPNHNIWSARAASFRTFQRCVLEPIEGRANRPLRAIDLGAGNGWFSHQLAKRGHLAAAVDLRTDAYDGLGVHVHYDVDLTPVQADFDLLPFASDQFDLAVFNGSLHYAEKYETTILEALRVLRPSGTLVVLDTPIYRSRNAGQWMVSRRERAFVARFGFASDAMSSEHFLTYERLRELADAAAVSWTSFRPYFGIRWILRPLAAPFLGRPAPADFLVIAAKKPVRTMGGGPAVTERQRRISLHPDESR